MLKVLLFGFVFSSCTYISSKTSSWPQRFKLAEPSTITLKEVHLDGTGLLNSVVEVGGVVQVIGKFNTYVVLEEDKVRMLVDLSKVESFEILNSLKQGRKVIVEGTVQSGAKGHFYIVAKTVFGA